jgi:hypothetical protein
MRLKSARWTCSPNVLEPLTEDCIATLFDGLACDATGLIVEFRARRACKTFYWHITLSHNVWGRIERLANQSQLPFSFCAAALNVDPVSSSSNSLKLMRQLQADYNEAVHQLLRGMNYTVFDGLDVLSNEANNGISLETACQELDVELSTALQQELANLRTKQSNTPLPTVKAQMATEIVKSSRWSVVGLNANLHHLHNWFAHLEEELTTTPKMYINIYEYHIVHCLDGLNRYACSLLPDAMTSLCHMPLDELRDLARDLSVDVTDGPSTNVFVASKLIATAKNDLLCNTHITRNNYKRFYDYLVARGHGRMLSMPQVDCMLRPHKVEIGTQYELNGVTYIVVGTTPSLSHLSENERPTEPVYKVAAVEGIPMSEAFCYRFESIQTVEDAVKRNPWLNIRSIAATKLKRVADKQATRV